MTNRGLIVRALPSVALGSTLLALSPACSSDDVAGAPTDGGPEAGAFGAGAGGRAVGSGGRATGTGGRSSSGGVPTASGGTAGGGAGGSMGASGGVVGSGGGIGTGGTGGLGGAGGTATDGGTAGGGADAAPDGGAPDARADSGPGPAEVLCAARDAAVSTSLLVAGTSYCSGCTQSELAAVDVANGCVLGRSTFADSDVGPRASGGRAFLVERSNGMLDVLTPSAAVTARIDLHGADGGSAYIDPHDVVFAHPSGGAAKAYVSLYGGDGIAVVDLDARRLETTIDLSAFLDTSDTDGSADPDVGFYDAATGRAYFVLQRTDVNTAYVFPFVIACPPVPSVLVAIDTTTDTLVDLNGGDAGVGLALGLVAPADVAVDEAARRALLLSNGCGRSVDGGVTRVLAGVESVNLDTLATSVLYAPTSQDFPSRIVLLGADSALIQSFDASFDTLWNQWAPSSSALGAALAGVPDLAVAETTDTLLGVAWTNGRPVVGRYRLSTQTTTMVVASPWVGAFTATAGVALVK